MNKFVVVGFAMCCVVAFAPLGIAGAAPALVPDAAITVPDSHGKFDFLEVDAANHRLLGSHSQDGTLDVFDLTTKKLLARVKTGTSQDAAVDDKTGKYFVSISEQKMISIVDAKTLAVTGSVAMEGPLDGILFDPKNRKVYAAHDDGKELWVVDADTEKLVGTVAIPGAPEYMVYDSVTDRIYLNIKTTDEIVVIDPASNAVIAHWPTTPAVGPHGLALDSATGRLFSAGKNGLLAVLNIKTGKVITSVQIASGVDQVAFDTVAKRVYCASGSSVFSVVQETDKGAMNLDEVETVAGARNVAVDPNTHAVWTTYSDGTNAYAKSWVMPKAESKK